MTKSITKQDKQKRFIIALKLDGDIHEMTVMATDSTSARRRAVKLLKSSNSNFQLLEVDHN
ncbi:hypothetical protein FEZ33_00410 [Ruoffia tabacinasalis]|uniref:Uncharacterized protein n=1 Tax=Ruoffia tabacinasalis TaxID=87458 RepID=A0A5R9EG41_9LACT|nr:hypothetical protein [Ruoffia tabacinasalis]TLQ49485.1 hypothetical protein FEZ33_00410 [Ruoffia tabacinasalis]